MRVLRWFATQWLVSLALLLYLWAGWRAAAGAASA